MNKNLKKIYSKKRLICSFQPITTWSFLAAFQLSSCTIGKSQDFLPRLRGLVPWRSISSIHHSSIDMNPGNAVSLKPVLLTCRPSDISRVNDVYSGTMLLNLNGVSRPGSVYQDPNLRKMQTKAILHLGSLHAENAQNNKICRLIEK
ncbi:hypothetical protein, partial [Candidatus Cardinium sp. cBcalN2]